MEMKPEKYIEAYPLRDALYWNLGMVLNGQGLGQYPVSDVMCHDLGIVSTEEGSDHYFLSGALCRCSGVKKRARLFTSSMGVKGKKASQTN